MKKQRNTEAQNKLVVRVLTAQFMRGSSWCFVKSVTPVKRKSTLSLDDLVTDIKENELINLYEVVDGFYTIETVNSYGIYGYIDDYEMYLKPYEE